jgi:hypothetical protein
MYRLKSTYLKTKGDLCGKVQDKDTGRIEDKDKTRRSCGELSNDAVDAELMSDALGTFRFFYFYYGNLI